MKLTPVLRVTGWYAVGVVTTSPIANTGSTKAVGVSKEGALAAMQVTQRWDGIPELDESLPPWKCAACAKIRQNSRPMQNRLAHRFEPGFPMEEFKVIGVLDATFCALRNQNDFNILNALF